MNLKDFQLKLVPLLLLVGCAPHYKTTKNGDLEVKLRTAKANPTLTIKNIGTQAVAIGIKDTIIWNDTILEVQVGEYSYLQTFMTDFKLLNMGEDHTLTIEKVKSNKYIVNLIYTAVNTNEDKSGSLQESTALLYPNGKFYLLNVDDNKITQTTRSIY